MSLQYVPIMLNLPDVTQVSYHRHICNC